MKFDEKRSSSPIPDPMSARKKQLKTSGGHKRVKSDVIGDKKK